MTKIPHLIELEQWICDNCGEVIENAADGWFEIIEDGASARVIGFKIVHHATAKSGCYTASVRRNLHLNELVGAEGLSYLVSFLDRGEHHGPQALTELDQAHIRDWVTILRRLHTPGYEEARFFFPSAQRSGDFGPHEVAPYRRAQLQGLINKYNP